MVSPAARKDRRESAFTLIELLVVVAIIALLISILLPSLSRARAQARTTLCLSRVAQITKAQLLYTDDYNETPPFVVTAHNWSWLNENPHPAEIWLYDAGKVYGIGGFPVDPNYDTNGNLNLAINAIEGIAYARQSAWPINNVVRSGTLYDYARFENVYKCPEFDRIKDGGKTHSAFNYTRAIWARRYLLPRETDGDDPWGDVSGPIMKPSQIVSPAKLPMMLDEQWNRFVACQPDLGDNDEACYNCNDCVFAEHNNMAVAHGQPVTSELHKQDIHRYGTCEPFVWKRAGVGFYDGHADLMRDIWPTFELGNNTRTGPWRTQSTPSRMIDEMFALHEFIAFMIHAQRGISDAEGVQEVGW